MSASDIEVVEQDPMYDGAVAEATQFLVDYWRSRYPTMDLQPARAVFDLLVRPAAELQGYQQTNLNRYRLASSLEAIRQDPTLVPDGDVDAILSNFRVTRQAGTTSSGTVTIILDADRVVSVPQGSQFEGNGLIFRSRATYLSTSGQLNTPYDRPLTKLADGTWAFTITVDADQAGPAYQLRSGTALEWSTPAAGYVRAYAESDFSPATNAETNTELMARFDAGMAAAAMAGRINIEGLIRNQFAGVQMLSETGYGDPEMLRDSHNIFGIKTGGKVDIYVRAASQLVTKTFTLDCVVIDPADHRLQVSIGRDVYPGFYFVSSILPVGATNTTGSLEVVQESRGFDVSGLSYVAPELQTAQEAQYTRFQTMVVQFRDPTLLSTTPIGTVVSYRFDLDGVPLIAEIQDYISNRSIRAPGADYLVRAPIPFLVAVSMQVDYFKGDDAVDVAAVQTEVANAINQIDFSRGRLSSSLVIDAAHNVLSGRANVHEPIDIMGYLAVPGQPVVPVRTSTGIDVPELLEAGVSARNVLFFTDVTAIQVNVQTTAAKSV